MGVEVNNEKKRRRRRKAALHANYYSLSLVTKDNTQSIRSITKQ